MTQPFAARAPLLRAAASIAMAGSALASPAWAQSQSAGQPATPSAVRSDPQDDIVVVASPQERGSIDRSTYLVRDNAEARAASALDLLGRVPSVDVSPTGQVRLIGRSGVTVLIDGQEVPNASALLRGMQGSEIERIEVATNPSAQFPARGTGGIINIVRRRNLGAGLGGSATGSLGNFGSYDAKLSPSWSGGKVALNGSIGAGRSGNRGDVEERRASIASGEEADRLERERSRGRTESQNASLKASVALGPKQRASLEALVMEFAGHSNTAAEIVEGGVASQERSTADSDSRLRRIAADYRREGSRPGGQTSISASHMAFELGSSRQFRTAGPDGLTLFRLRNDLSASDTVFKADHVRPSGDRRLSVGGQFQRNAEENRQRSLAPPPAGEAVAADASFEGEWSEAAAYATYQFPFAGGTVLAGTRVEARWYDIAGVSDDPAGGTHVFPNLHVERTLGRWLTANLSTSSRINWPGIALLDPRPRFSDPATARAGNPDLRPEKTHSLELKLMARWGRHDADLTGYYQRTRDLRGDLAGRVGEVLVTRPVNIGTRMSRGGSLLVRGRWPGACAISSRPISRGRRSGRRRWPGTETWRGTGARPASTMAGPGTAGRCS